MTDRHTLDPRGGEMAEQTSTSAAPAILMTHPKLIGRANMKGEWYEVKMSALLYLRGTNSSLQFQLATNVEGAGALDDIVFRVKIDKSWITVFIQLKHKSTSRLCKGMLLGTKGDFALKKYYTSFTDIKQLMFEDNRPMLFDGSFDSAYFIIYTNASVHRDLQNPARVSTSCLVDGFVLSGGDSEFIFSLTEVDDADAYLALEKQGDDARDFLNRLRIFTGQPTEKQLDDIIEGELREHCKNTDTEYLDTIYQVYVDAFMNWWQDSETILDQNNVILKQALSQARIEYLIPQQKEKFRFHINFLESSTAGLKDACAGQYAFLNVVVDESVRITSSKLLQILDAQKESVIFVGSQCLLKERDAVLSAWNHGKKNMLIIASEPTGIECDEVCTEIWRVHAAKREKRIILLSLSDDLMAGILKKMMGKEAKVHADSFQPSHLDKESAKTIREKKVIFQGQLSNFGLLFDKDIDELSAVFGGCLEEIIASKQISFGAELKEDINYYVTRTIMWNNEVKNTIFYDNSYAGRIFIQGAAMDEISKFIPTHRSKIYTEEKSIVFDLRTERGLNENAKKTRNDVHFFDLIGERLMWKKSEGDINLIKKHLLTSGGDSTQDPGTRVAILVAEPGMGKTTFLRHLALEIKQSCHKLWVVYIELNDHSSKLATLIEENLNAEMLICSVLGVNEELSQIERMYLKHVMNVSGDIVVLLDGFDEVAPWYASNCCALVKSLLKTKVQRIWITSRYSMMEMLESNLSTLAGTLTMFSEDDQRNFLRSYWGESSSFSQQELDKFVNDLLHTTARSLSDTELVFTGIPLQTQMLAEVFQDYVTDRQMILPMELNLLQLIEGFIARKLYVYLKRNHISTETLSFEFFMEEQREIFDEKHMIAALILLFNGDDYRNLNNINVDKAERFFANVKSGLDKTGIVDRIVDGKPSFLHRVFAEYYVALWIARHYAVNREFLHIKLLGNTFGVVRNMLDRILCRDYKLHNAVLNENLEEVAYLVNLPETNMNERDKGGRTALHLIVTAGLNNQATLIKSRFPNPIIELLIKHNARADIEDDVLQWSPAHYSYATWQWTEMDLLLGQGQIDVTSFNTCINMGNLNNQHLWESVIKYEYVNICNLLLDILEALLSQQIGENHSSIKQYYKSKTVEVLHRSALLGSPKIVQVLINRASSSRSNDSMDSCKTLLKAVNDDDQNALMISCFRRNRSVAQVILDSFEKDSHKIKYINTCNRKSQSALWLVHEARCNDIISLLIESGADPSLQDLRGYTVLIDASSKGDVAEVQALLSAVTNSKKRKKFVNMCDFERQTALWYAVKKGRNDVISLLIESGADPNRKNVYGWTMLMSASYAGRLSVVQSLLSQFQSVKRNVNTRNIDGRSALWYAAQMEHKEVFSLLLASGADLTVSDKCGVTMLMYASESNKPFVETLLTAFTDDKQRLAYVNARNKWGRTALWLANEREQPSAKRLLIEAGGTL